MASEIRTNSITSRTGLSTISLTSTGPIFAGIATFTGSIGIAGTLTYEDVTNIDSVGIITARSDVHVGTGIHFTSNDGVIQTGSSGHTLGIQGGATNMGGRIELRGGNATGDIRMFAQGATSTQVERLRIKSDGKTGIGTDDPQTIFHILDNVPTIRFTDKNSTGTPDCEVGGAGGNVDISADINGEKSDSVIRFNVDGGVKLLINHNGKVVAGNDGTTFGNAAVQAFIQHGSTAGESGFSSVDTTSVAAGVGGEIAFHGKYNTGAQDYAYTGHIRGIKENATAGNTACALTLHTRPNATAPIERLRITSGGDTELRNIVSGINDSYSQYLKFRTTQTNGQSAVTAAIRAQGKSGWGGDLVFYSKPANSTPNDTVTENMRVDRNGLVTKPNQAMFAAQGSGDAISAQFTLPFDSILYNIGSHYNNSTYKFGIPVDGYYYVTCHVVPTNYATNANNVELYIKNNSGTRYFLDRKVKSSNYSTNNFSVGGSRIIYAGAGDALWVEFNAISGSPTLESSSHFGIMLMA